MDRSEYLTQTSEKFSSQAIESVFLPNLFEPSDGVIRVLEIICDKDQRHPKHSQIPFIFKCKCIWKPSLEDDFLEEFNRWFDLTQLIEDWKMLDGISAEDQNDPGTKAGIFHIISQRRDIEINDIKSGNWKFIEKINQIIVSNELREEPSILIGKRLLPLPEIPERKAKIYTFSKEPINFNSGLYPEDAEIIQITEENFKDILEYEIGPSLYFQNLNDFRNQYGTQMADTVPIKGYYKIYAIRLEPPREYEKIINGKIKIEPAPWDLPYQIIGIGHWLDSNLSEPVPLRFNRNISVEVRLNPLFNNVATIKGLDINFPREKNIRTFYTIANQRIIKINDVKLEENAYVIDWEVFNHSDFLEMTGIS